MTIYLLRHAEKTSSNGVLTKRGEMAAKTLGKKLPVFKIVIASSSERSKQTAKLISSQEPIVDARADFSMSSPPKSDAINALAYEKNITFLEAAILYDNKEVLDGIEAKAKELNELLEELRKRAGEGAALVVSHDLSISPAMSQRGAILQSIDFLHGYVIHDNGSIMPFSS